MSAVSSTPPRPTDPRGFRWGWGGPKPRPPKDKPAGAWMSNIGVTTSATRNSGGRVIDVRLLIDDDALRAKFPLRHQRRRFMLKLNEAVRRCAVDLGDAFQEARR